RPHALIGRECRRRAAGSTEQIAQRVIELRAREAAQARAADLQVRPRLRGALVIRWLGSARAARPAAARAAPAARSATVRRGPRTGPSRGFSRARATVRERAAARATDTRSGTSSRWGAVRDRPAATREQRDAQAESAASSHL